MRKKALFLIKWAVRLFIQLQSARTRQCKSLFCAGALLCTKFSLAATYEQLESIQNNITIKEYTVYHQQKQRSALLLQLKRQEEVISAARCKIHKTQNILTKLNKQVNEINKLITQLEGQFKLEKRNLLAQLEATFRQGNHTGIQLIFRNKEIQRIHRLQTYFGYLNQVRQERIAKLKQTHKKINIQKTKLEEKQNQQKTLIYKQKLLQTNLEEAQNTRKKTLANLESSIQQGQKQLSIMRSNKAELSSSITKSRTREEACKAQILRNKQKESFHKKTIYQSIQNERSSILRTSTLGSQCSQTYWPVHGSILHHYGEQLQGELRWKGVVISASEGSQVKVIADGLVILADWIQGYGLVIVVEHGKGDMSLYAYNKRTLVNVGTKVYAGQPIALVGRGTGQGYPSLYFEIRRQGQPVDPQLWLKK